MQGQALAHVVLVVLAMILAVGMSWSHLSRRMTGQLDTDAVE
jgi:Tfp pilus assembly protein PilO